MERKVLFKVKSNRTGYVYSVYDVRTNRWGKTEYYIDNWAAAPWYGGLEWWDSKRFTIYKEPAPNKYKKSYNELVRYIRNCQKIIHKEDLLYVIDEIRGWNDL